jgi:hypothetical protein
MPQLWQIAAGEPARDYRELFLDRLLNVLEQVKRLSTWYKGKHAGDDRPTEHEVVAHILVPLLRSLGWSEQLLGVEWNRVDVAVFDRTPTTISKLFCASCRPSAAERGEFGPDAGGAVAGSSRALVTLHPIFSSSPGHRRTHDPSSEESRHQERGSQTPCARCAHRRADSDEPRARRATHTHPAWEAQEGPRDRRLLLPLLHSGPARATDPRSVGDGLHAGAPECAPSHPRRARDPCQHAQMGRRNGRLAGISQSNSRPLRSRLHAASGEAGGSGDGPLRSDPGVHPPPCRATTPQEDPASAVERLAMSTSD